MLKSKNFYSIPLLLSAFIFFNPVCYGDVNVISDAYANAGGHGHGDGHGHENGHGNWNGHGHGKAHNQKNWTNADKNAAKSNNMRFTDRDSTVITKYYTANPFPVTPLPPGIAMNLLRGKPLPPGIAKVFLPSNLVSQLPVYPGYDYLVAGRDVLLVNSQTNVVSDILANVLR